MLLSSQEPLPLLPVRCLQGRITLKAPLMSRQHDKINTQNLAHSDWLEGRPTTTDEAVTPDVASGEGRCFLSVGCQAGST